MATSLQRVVFCLLVLASLTKALRIRNGNRCLNCPGSVTIGNNNNLIFWPDLIETITLLSCTTIFNDPWENYWTYTANQNFKINICIQTADACLGVKLQVNEKERRIDGKAVVLAQNTTNSKQEWMYDVPGRKLTNMYMGPTYCAQAEKEGLMMVPCNANEPKQKIEIGNF